ncbi:MAG: Nitrogen-fixing NifU protein [uncultured bacterium]|nr:MAG: Nitrogen-fixing NifU protein [uncultured bacterium]
MILQRSRNWNGYKLKETLAQTIEKALDEIRPYLHSHGGDITVMSVQDSKLYVKFKGACVGCPISLYTLKLGVEEKIKERIPEIKQVIAVEHDHEVGADFV